MWRTLSPPNTGTRILPQPLQALLLPLLLVLIPQPSDAASRLLRSHWRRSETASIAPADDETLREAFQLLNMGKQTLGLRTESPQLLLEMAEGNGTRPGELEQVMEDSADMQKVPEGEQYLVLSGDESRVSVKNFTDVTDSPAVAQALEKKNKGLGNESRVEDIFKMTLQKVEPKGTHNTSHNITIVEKNELTSNKDAMGKHVRSSRTDRCRRRLDERCMRGFGRGFGRFGLDRRRRRRRRRNRDTSRQLGMMGEDPSFAPSWNDTGPDPDAAAAETIAQVMMATQTKKDSRPGYVVRRHRKVPRRGVSSSLSSGPMRYPVWIEKYLLKIATRAPNVTGDLEASSGGTSKSAPDDLSSEKSIDAPFLVDREMLERAFMESYVPPRNSNPETRRPLENVLEVGGIILIGSIGFLAIFLIYRRFIAKKSSDAPSRTVEVRGSSLTVNVREGGKSQLKFQSDDCSDTFDADDPLAKFEWQSEVGEWLTEGDGRGRL